MANELKQTPTESLFFIMESFIAKKDRIHLKGVLEQAKEMEKEQFEKLKDFETWKEWKDL